MTVPDVSGSNSGGSGGGNSGGSGGRSGGSGGGSVSVSSAKAIEPDTYPGSVWSSQSDGTWMLLKSDGIPVQGWAIKNGRWYYMDPETKLMKTGWHVETEVGVKEYYLDSNGAMLVGWFFLDGAWYYTDTSGEICHGWKLIDGKWYYLGTDGKLLVNTVTPDGFQVNENGERIS